ncbi:MAG TPA: sugar transferase [Actinomycetes bacterium]|nr:sugar transferase [Actinomycetes bacterium]
MSDRGSRRHVVRASRGAVTEGRSRNLARGHRPALDGTPSSTARLEDDDRPRVVHDRLEVVHDYRPGRSRPRMQARYLLIAGDLSVALFYILLHPANLRVLLLTLALTMTLFASGHLYSPRLHLSLLDETPALLGRMATSIGVVALFLAVSSGRSVRHFLVLASLGALLQLMMRGIVFAFLRLARKRGLVSHRTVFLGGGMVTQKLAATLRNHPEYGLRAVGCVDRTRPVPETEEVAPWLGSTDQLEQILDMHGVNILIIAFGNEKEEDLVALIRQRAFARRQVFVVPRMFEMDVAQRAGDHIGAYPIVRLPRRALSGPSWRFKRAFDLVVASLAMICLAPVLLACAIAVRLEGGRGVIFRQVRIGKDGEPFELLKFRSMRPEAPGDADVTWNIKGNPRVGPVGRVLRKTSLDELPQLWNIIRGDMTIVGPRPERPYFVEQFSADFPRYPHRHRVPVGLTGLAQVSGLRGDTSIEDRARYDNFYIESWSFWLDLKVLLRTVREVVRGGGG